MLGFVYHPQHCVFPQHLPLNARDNENSLSLHILDVLITFHETCFLNGDQCPIRSPVDVFAIYVEGL